MWSPHTRNINREDSHKPLKVKYRQRSSAVVKDGKPDSPQSRCIALWQKHPHEAIGFKSGFMLRVVPLVLLRMMVSSSLASEGLSIPDAGVSRGGGVLFQLPKVQLESQDTFSLQTMKNNDRTNNTLEVKEAAVGQLDFQPFIPSAEQWKDK